MASRSRLTVIALGILAALAPTGGMPAAQGSALTAQLEGRAISVRSVGRYHCHDFDHPRIVCFRSARRLEAAVSAGVRAASIPAALNYVRVFADATFAGSSAYLSANYTSLGAIGWNDRISSFKALNGLAGSFFTAVSYGGSPYAFCCNQQVTYVGNAFNDTFSSVRRT